MDVYRDIAAARHEPLTCIEMHTTGEPTRIVIAGYPNLSGTLLQQRAQAKAEYDHLRRRLMLEPRGHADMYGAILRSDTEKTRTHEAHMGVLFTTNDGYSTMCGHATIALGRFLVDTHDLSVFPLRDRVSWNTTDATATLVLHAPCGLINVFVPTVPDGSRSDPCRPVSFICVPSFTMGVDVVVPLAPQYRWPELKSDPTVQVDFAYGGAFYSIVSASALGFPNGLATVDLDAMNRATRLLKAAINANPDLRYLFRHPDEEDLGFLYSVMVVDKTLGLPLESSSGAETGLCYFADQAIDRSPTGSCVAARVALAHAKGELDLQQRHTYHSLVSNTLSPHKGGFVGSVVEILPEPITVGSTTYPMVRVLVQGYAYYVGTHVFTVEEGDELGRSGFRFEQLSGSAASLS